MINKILAVVFSLALVACGGGSSSSGSASSGTSGSSSSSVACTGSLAPDLVYVSNSAPNPVSQIRVGQTIYIYAAVLNSGTCDATGGITMRVSIDDARNSVVTRWLANELAPNKILYSNGDVRFIAEPSDVGVRTVTVSFSSGNRESNTANNSYSEQFTFIR